MEDTCGSEHLSFDSEHRLRAENLPYDIDVWYPLVKSFTFRSVFLPLLKTECKAIQAYYNVVHRRTQSELTSQDIDALQRLKEDVDALLEREFSGKKECFVRLCGRSPKDGDPLHPQQVYADYNLKLESYLKEKKMTPTNAKMAAIAQTSWLKVRSGAEAMALVLSSERVYSDMLDWDRFGEPEQLCLRAWDQSVTMDFEFRVFVYRDKITAISQYDHYAYYPHLESIKQKIEASVRSLWKKVHKALKISSYVLDVAYDESSGACIMIELSPFLPCTGPALFSWSNETDMQILEGKLPFEFKLKKESDLHPQLCDLLDINWDERWKREINHTKFDQVFHEAKVRKFSIKTLVLLGILPLGVSSVYANSHISNSKQTSICFAVLFVGLAALMLWSFKHSVKKENIDVMHNSRQQLFVYGTLKRNFHWNQKYLHNRVGPNGELNSKYLGAAVTAKQHVLTIGKCGVPYLSLCSEGESSSSIGDKGHILGELWEVSSECLKNLDDYEGIGKKYYKRTMEPVITLNDSSTEIKAHVYFLDVPVSELLARTSAVSPTAATSGTGPILEYDLKIHKTLYNPIEHIQIKQLKYLDHKTSNWGHLPHSIPQEPWIMANSESI